jgi:hypothetical protein
VQITVFARFGKKLARILLSIRRLVAIMVLIVFAGTSHCSISERDSPDKIAGNGVSVVKYEQKPRLQS